MLLGKIVYSRYYEVAFSEINPEIHGNRDVALMFTTPMSEYKPMIELLL
jgi:hypothetical protein